MEQKAIVTDPRLRQLQLCELEILQEFVRICQKHDLNYYLIAGTLLGAVRHQGFIPWDDDIDVVMLRKDYDRFAEICKEELDSKYFYQSPDTDPHYFLTYAKLRKNDTEVFEERFQHSEFHKGVFLDVFPLDYCPKPGLICHFLFNVLAVMNYRGQIDSGEEYIPYKELSGKFGYAVLRMFSPRRLVLLRKKLLRLSAALSRKKYVASYAGAYGYYKDVYPCECYRSGATAVFEEGSYAVPADPQSFLTQIFGDDFMQIPPPEKRYTHIDVSKIVL